jgi:hypothetical protein
MNERAVSNYQHLKARRIGGIGGPTEIGRVLISISLSSGGQGTG